jgi:hypothetical protein
MPIDNTAKYWRKTVNKDQKQASMLTLKAKISNAHLPITNRQEGTVMAEYDIPLKPYGSTAGRDHLSTRPRPKTPTLDFHIHMSIPAADDLVKPHLPDEPLIAVRLADPVSREQSNKHHAERLPMLTDIPTRLKDMDKMQLDVAAISCSPSQFYYAAEPSLGAESAEIVNNGLAAKIKEAPNRHVGLGTVPLQDTDLAIRELKRCINELGFGGIQIGARVSETEEISTPRLDPFWEAAYSSILILKSKTGSPSFYEFDRQSARYYCWRTLSDFRWRIGAFPKSKICAFSWWRVHYPLLCTN